MNQKLVFQNIDDYHRQFAHNIQERLHIVRNIFATAVPQAQEVISYQMPAYKFNKVLVYYAAYKNHIGIYPGSEAIVFFKEKLSDYKTSKGAIQIPHEVAIPKKLLKEIIRYRLKAVM